MSSPIAIVIPKAASESSGSPSSSMASSLTSAGLYVPVHKRAGSTSSRATSPSPSSSPKSDMSDLPAEPAHPFIYSPTMLLSLRPLADKNVRERIRAACPEVLMNRKMRKTIEHMGHQHQTKKAVAPKPVSTTPTPAPTVLDAAVQHPELPARQPVQKRPSVTTPAQRVSSTRRNGPAGRAPERRRQALHAFGAGKESDSWRTRIPPSVVV